MSFGVKEPVRRGPRLFLAFSSLFCTLPPPRFSFALLKNAAKVPSASVTSLGQSDLPVEIITYGRLSRETTEANRKVLA